MGSTIGHGQFLVRGKAGGKREVLSGSSDVTGRIKSAPPDGMVRGIWGKNQPQSRPSRAVQARKRRETELEFQAKNPIPFADGIAPEGWKGILGLAHGYP